MKKIAICSTKPFNKIELNQILHEYDLMPVQCPTLNDELEFVLAIGGDGAVLKSMSIAVDHNIPILGYHTGTLGFLTSGENLMTLLSMWACGEFMIEGRMLLNISAHFTDPKSNETNQHHFKAMNEVAIVSDNVGSLLINKVDINGVYTTTYKGDGLCISTPSGSTAWNLSAGGPIMHPTVETVVLTPMNPFTLSTRPLVVDSESIIEIEPAGQVIIDGRKINEERCEKLIISRYGSDVMLFLHKDHDFYEAIRSKLGWNNNIKQ